MNQNYVVVCVSERAIESAFNSELWKIFNEHQVEVKSTRDYAHFTTFDLSHFESLNLSLMNLSQMFRVDIGLIPEKIFNARKGLVVFDMDSTLITSEVIVEMAARHGVGEKVKLITDRAMNGELNFDQSLSERIALLKGFHRSHMDSILKSLRFTPGTPEFLKALNHLGIKTAIASGGFQYFAKSIQAQLKMDYVFANELEFENDILTGVVQGPIVNAEAKQQIVLDLAKELNLSLDQVVAIGDGANDIPMLLTAGMGIAIHAKERVQKTARFRLNFGPMTHALSYMNHEAL